MINDTQFEDIYNMHKKLVYNLCLQYVLNTEDARDITGNDNANLIGFLRDGFPIYARKDNDGTYPSNLDANGDHIGATADFPNGIYHYHAANTAYMGSRFYVLKAGSYNGTKGTFTF